MITTLAIASWDALGSIVWGVTELWQQQVKLWIALILTTGLLVTIGGAFWPYFWNKQWKIWKAKTADMMGAGVLILLITASVLTMVGMGSLADAQAYRGENIISNSANVSTLNGSSFSTLRKMLLNSCEDKEILQIFKGGNKKGKVDSSDPKLNINPQSPNAKALTSWARNEMTKALDSWKSAYNAALYTALAGVILYLAFIWWCAYSDIDEKVFRTKEAEAELDELDELENEDDVPAEEEA